MLNYRGLSALCAVGMLVSCSAETPPGAELIARMNALCGKAFAGEITSNDPRDADWASERLVIHFRDCSPSEVRAPFHVGEDHSRTFIITQLEHGLRFKHDHRHEDGEPDALSMYGGETADKPTGLRADFPVDDFSREMFEEQGYLASMDNVWSIEVTGDSFTYELNRPNRHFEVTFDLTQEVETPPPAWGSEATSD